VRHGGTVILSESPETYGAEHLLTRRAVSREVGEKLVAVMKWWEDYTAKHGGTMDNKVIQTLARAFVQRGVGCLVVAGGETSAFACKL